MRRQTGIIGHRRPLTFWQWQRRRGRPCFRGSSPRTGTTSLSFCRIKSAEPALHPHVCGPLPDASIRVPPIRISKEKPVCVETSKLQLLFSLRIFEHFRRLWPMTARMNSATAKPEPAHRSILEACKLRRFSENSSGWVCVGGVVGVWGVGCWGWWVGVQGVGGGCGVGGCGGWGGVWGGVGWGGVGVLVWLHAGCWPSFPKVSGEQLGHHPPKRAKE